MLSKQLFAFMLLCCCLTCVMCPDADMLTPELLKCWELIVSIVEHYLRPTGYLPEGSDIDSPRLPKGAKPLLPVGVHWCMHKPS